MPYAMIYTPPTPSEMPDLSEFMTTEEAARKLNFHIQSVRHLMRNNKLEGVKIGRTWLVSKKSVDEYLAEIQTAGKHNPRRNQK